MPSPDIVAAVADRLRLLAEPTRLTICVALAQGEANPGCMAELAGVAPAALSQQLSRLRLAGVVKARRDGQRIWYKLVDADVRALVEHLLRSPALLCSSAPSGWPPGGSGPTRSSAC